MTRKLEILECSIVATATGVELATKRAAGPPKEIAEVGVDEALAKARELIRQTGKQLKNLNVLQSGDIRAIVWAKGPPVVGPAAGMIWKRPPSTEAPRT